MVVYTFSHPEAPHGQLAFPSLRKARTARAKLYRRKDRPEIMRVDVGGITLDKVCALLSGKGYAVLMEDVA